MTNNNNNNNFIFNPSNNQTPFQFNQTTSPFANPINNPTSSLFTAQPTQPKQSLFGSSSSNPNPFLGVQANPNNPLNKSGTKSDDNVNAAGLNDKNMKESETNKTMSNPFANANTNAQGLFGSNTNVVKTNLSNAN